MIHYSCDRCGRPIDPQDDMRYIVRLEVEAIMAPLEDQVVEDEDRDHLMELHEIIERSESGTESLTVDGDVRRERFDLCSECHRKFIRNPLGKDSAKQLDFSNN